MKNWKHLFEDKILDRGYFLTDDVEIIKRNDEKVTATVSGTLDYKTQITFDDGLVGDMYCSCPYFEIDNCKHLAALLYVLEEGDDVAVEEEDFTELFNSVNDDDLRQFIYSELENDKELLNRFKLKFSNTINSDYYRTKLDKICFRDNNRYAINDFLTHDMHFLLDKNEYELVLELLDYVFPYIKEWWNFWEDYGSDGNMEEFRDITELLINTPVHDDVFEWLGDLIYYIPDDDHMDELIELYFTEFESIDEMKAKEKLSDKLYDKTQNVKWIKIKIDLMEKLDYPLDDINDFRKDYLEYEVIIDQYIDSTQGSEKERLLIKAIGQFRYNEKYKVQLKDYYLANKDCGKYLKLLEEMVFTYPNIEYYKEYEKHYKGDWTLKRREILENHCEVNHFLNECFAHEKRYDLLINNVHTLWDLNDYRDVLVKDYSDEVIRKYSKIAIGKAQKSGPPKHYREIAEILKIIRKIPGGADKVEIIVENFKEEYKRRPRMLKELRNAGF